MTTIDTMSPQERKTAQNELGKRYREYQSRHISLDMTRGKPCPAQLDLSLGMIDSAGGRLYRAQDGTDCRNYGGLDGIPEAKALFADYMEVAPAELIIGGNSSLTLMHDAMAWAVLFGVAAGSTPWGRQGHVKFLCPSPGYDRHFAICEHLGIEMITVAMKADGPDMEAVEQLAAGDAAVKGIWCVPKYSNPTGAVYSDDVVGRLAAMPTQAPDFRIFWDNAYTVHHLDGAPARLASILDACRKSGHPDRALLFGSTSKISFAGSGLAFLAGSPTNVTWAKNHLGFQTIGPDKLSQLRHVAFFKDMAGVLQHMQKHAAILKPKFDAVLEVLERELGGKGAAEWTRPTGGYFISIDTPPGCARRVVQMTTEAGVRLTPAGAPYPYQEDPLDRNIRIAPSFPPVADIRTAIEVLGLCIQLARLEKLEGK